MSNSEGESDSGPDLGIIKREDDLRRVWPNEAADFTPWLAENIERLGEALGMDLEVDAQEASVGSYTLDILARDQDNRQVVIENQLGATDHTHLGQLLTYAAGFDANVIVWIAGNFRDEHREALDLLNRRTGEDTEFFGVEVELWKNGNSRLVPNFKLVAAPDEWRKQTVSRPRAAGRGWPMVVAEIDMAEPIPGLRGPDKRWTRTEQGDFIRRVRVALGMSQPDFAKELRVGWRQVCRWETGQALPNPRAHHDIQRLLEAPPTRAVLQAAKIHPFNNGEGQSQ